MDQPLLGLWDEGSHLVLVHKMPDCYWHCYHNADGEDRNEPPNLLKTRAFYKPSESQLRILKVGRPVEQIGSVMPNNCNRVMQPVKGGQRCFIEHTNLI